MHGSDAARSPAKLLHAYASTRYRILDQSDPDAALAEAVVDVASSAVDAVLDRHGADSGVFITAWNPRSVPQSCTVNEAAHGRLEQDLRRRAIRFLPHAGVGIDPAWEAERGVLALDLPLTDALALAVAYGQNAVVVVSRGRPARLVLTQLMSDQPCG